MKNFILIGAAGYIAPRHMQAIKETGNNLLAILDKSDSVGVIDSFFPKAEFFTEFERFDRHIDKLQKEGIKIDFVSICTPNYLHDFYIRYALRIEANAICEKPVVLNTTTLDRLIEEESRSSNKVYTILQLRLHPTMIALRDKISKATNHLHIVSLTYVTARGPWYSQSWKGDESKSGGIITNIGIHFLDMLIWLFGGVREAYTLNKGIDHADGYIALDKAVVDWSISINDADLPDGMRSYRKLIIDDKEIDFTEGFNGLHTQSYEQILNDNGYRLIDARPAVDLASQLRHTKEIIHEH